jgi:hypothetical protein
MTIAWWHWLALGLVLIALEMRTHGGFYILVFGVTAILRQRPEPARVRRTGLGAAAAVPAAFPSCRCWSSAIRTSAPQADAGMTRQDICMTSPPAGALADKMIAGCAHRETSAGRDALASLRAGVIWRCVPDRRQLVCGS